MSKRDNMERNRFMIELEAQISDSKSIDKGEQINIQVATPPKDQRLS